MGHENAALKSWLPQAGTVHRTIILKKLKRSLEKRGLTRAQVYKGLLQLATTPRVLIPKWSIPDYTSSQCYVDNTDVVEQKESSWPEEIDHNKKNIEDSKISRVECHTMHKTEFEDHSTNVSDVTNLELFQERVKNESPFMVKIPREAIMLNLDLYTGQAPNVTKNRKVAQSTEIRLADSSVSDGENPPKMQRTPSKKEYRVTETSSKKPKIIEDVTCVEGTILARNSLINLSRETIGNRANTRITTKATTVCEKLKEKNPRVIHPEFRITSKMLEPKKDDCISKKLQLRRRFRQLFGTDLTESELDEEVDIVERFVRKKRRKKDQKSSRSIELETKRQRLVEKREFQEERVPLTPEVKPVDKTSHETAASDTFVQPVQLLDSSAASEVKSEIENSATTFPDSSTCSEGNLDMEEEVSMEETANKSSTGTMIILISPVDNDSPDAFAPVKLEIDVPCETQVAAPISEAKSTTVPSTTTGKDSLDITKLLDTNILNGNSNILSNGNNISTEDDFEDIIPSVNYSGLQEDTTNETTKPDCSNTEITEKSGNPEENGSIKRLSPTCSNDTTPLVEDTITNNMGKELEGATASTGSLCPPPPAPPIQKFRVLHPSELGSRWCPTPLNEAPSSTHEVTMNEFFNRSPAPPVISPLSADPDSNRDCQTQISGPNSIYGSNEPSNVNNLGAQQSYCQSYGSATSASTSYGLTDSTLGTILTLLLSLNFCIDRNTTLLNPYQIAQLQSEYLTKKSSLCKELKKFGSDIGSFDIGHIITSVVRYYEELMPPADRILNMEKVLNVIRLNQLPFSQPERIGMQIQSASSIPRQSSFQASQSSPKVPLFNSGKFPPFYTPRPSPPTALYSKNQRPTHPELCSLSKQLSKHAPNFFAVTTSPTAAIFTHQQRATLWYQIIMYNYLSATAAQKFASTAAPRVRRRRKPSQKKTVPMENTARTEIPPRKHTNEETLLPTLLDEFVHRNHQARTTSVIQPTPLIIAPPENVIQSETSESANNNNDPNNDEPKATNDANNVVSVADVVQEMAVHTFQPKNKIRSNNRNDKNNNNKDQGLIVTEASTSPPTTSVESTTVESVEMMDVSPDNSLEPMNQDCEKTEIEKSDKAQSCRNSENETAVNEVEADPKISQEVPVINLDECDSVSSAETITPNEIEPNFSIFDVKSISKDVFNTMAGTSNNVKESSNSSPEIVEGIQTNMEDDNSSVSELELRDCLRCGQPSSVVCEQCFDAYYCSTECHTMHWEEHHYLTCKPVPEGALI